MPYAKQYFLDETELDAAHLNHMEDGIAEALKLAENGISSGDTRYYRDLSAALADVNADADDNALPGADGACVRVFTGGGRATVTVLRDVSESTAMTVDKDIDLVLDGHKISFTAVAASLIFGAGTSCTINGEASGSAIVKGEIADGAATLVAGKTGNDRICFIEANGDLLSVCGGRYEIGVSAGYVVHAIRMNSTAKRVDVSGCDIQVRNLVPLSGAAAYNASTSCVSIMGGVFHAEKTCFCAEAQETVACAAMMQVNTKAVFKDCTLKSRIYTASVVNGKSNYAWGLGLYGASVSMEHSLIYADSPGAHANEGASSGIKSQTSSGISSVIHLKDTEVYATFAGLDGVGDVCVCGGLLSGYTHGGFYLCHTQENNVYFQDTVCWNGFVFQDSVIDRSKASVMSNGYLGLTTVATTTHGGDVYMDGCTFGFEGAQHPAFCVRDTHADVHPNRLFVSNTKISTASEFRIINRSGNKPGEVKIGFGCNFTPDDVRQTAGENGVAEVTDAVYRKQYR